MKLEVNNHAQKLSDGAIQQLLGLMVHLEPQDSAQDLLAGIKNAFLIWKSEHGDLAVMLKASVKGEDQVAKTCFEALLAGWNDDAEVQAASNTLIDFDFFLASDTPLMSLTNKGQAAQGNVLRLQIFQ